MWRAGTKVTCSSTIDVTIPTYISGEVSYCITRSSTPGACAGQSRRREQTPQGVAPSLEAEAHVSVAVREVGRVALE
jgi:hypothetical protein